ncbi:MAG: glycosyltransferase family 4 protein [Planctomycetota bacterium]|jgi:glycosyltransferase involved in cell wall biosynthesis
MPRILLVHPFAHDISGADESILAVMKHLVPQGWNYDVVLPGEGAYVPRYEALGCRVFTYPMSIIKRRLDIPYLLGFLLRFIPTILFLRKAIRETQPDLIHVNGAVIMGGGLAARLCGVPAVYHIRCSQIAHPRFVAAILARLMAWTAKKTIAISQACAAPMTERGFDDRTTIIHNGIDLSRFQQVVRSDLWRQACGWPEDALVIGQVGRIAPIKGWFEYLQVCTRIKAEVPNAHFVAVGSPFLDSEKVYEEELKQAVKKAGLSSAFHFAGRRTDIPEVMAGLDLFITMAKEEGFGRVAVECMASGTPILANRVDGLAEIVRDGETGYLVGPNNIEETVEKAITLLRDSQQRKAFGAAARRYALDAFRAEECATRTAQVYQEVLSALDAGRGTAL